MHEEKHEVFYGCEEGSKEEKEKSKEDRKEGKRMRQKVKKINK